MQVRIGKIQGVLRYYLGRLPFILLRYSSHTNQQNIDVGNKDQWTKTIESSRSLKKEVYSSGARFDHRNNDRNKEPRDCLP